VIAAYRSVLDLDPDQTTALNNLAVELNATGNYLEAEQLALRAMNLGLFWYYASNAMEAQAAQGKWADAQATIDRRAAAGLGWGGPFLSPHVRNRWGTDSIIFLGSGDAVPRGRRSRRRDRH